MIPIFSNTLGVEELAAVTRVFASRWLGPGKERELFEQELAAYWNTDRVLATNSCTSAIYIILKTLGIGPGDEVIIPDIHFVACLSAIVDLGATPVFCDVDPFTLNTTAGLVRPHVSDRTKAVILLHYGGHICDVDGIREVVGDAYIVEDAANAPASRIGSRAAGTLGDAGCWSFDSMKIITTGGDGGALWFRDNAHYERAKRLRFLGIDSRSGMDSLNRKDRWWEYELSEPSGYFDMNDVMAAIGREQLKKLDSFVARRQVIWEMYNKGLRGTIIRAPGPPRGTTSSYYLYWICDVGRDRIARFLADNGIYCTFRYYPLSQTRRHASLASVLQPGARVASEYVLNLPIHQNLTDEEVRRIIDTIGEWKAENG